MSIIKLPRPPLLLFPSFFKIFCPRFAFSFACLGFSKRFQRSTTTNNQDSISPPPPPPPPPRNLKWAPVNSPLKRSSISVSRPSFQYPSYPYCIFIVLRSARASSCSQHAFRIRTVSPSGVFAFDLSSFSSFGNLLLEPLNLTISFFCNPSI